MRCENKKIKNDSKISGLSNLKLPTTEMRIAVYVDGAGQDGRFGREEQDSILDRLSLRYIIVIQAEILSRQLTIKIWSAGERCELEKRESHQHLESIQSNETNTDHQDHEGR